MTEHLPECCVGTDDCKAEPCLRCHSCCICEQLRACEQRMREEHRHRCSGCDWCYSDGVREALDAARKAVAACTSDRPSMRGMLISVNDALAAIDALRGKP